MMRSRIPRDVAPRLLPGVFLDATDLNETGTIIGIAIMLAKASWFEIVFKEASVWIVRDHVVTPTSNHSNSSK